MTLTIFMITTMTLLSNSVFSNHPLTMSMKVLLLALSLCATLSYTTTWYAYMLFMITVGGMLVMFLYISSLSPNAIFYSKPKPTQVLTQLVPTIFLALMIIPMPGATNTQTQSSPPSNFITFFMEDETVSLLLGLACLLLLSMLMVMSIIPQKGAPMRGANFRAT
uniref:NADH dehydrogenase subunit 6 n=1 Tax=Sinohyriopsis cumingii TaxID=165450 RepID=A0A0C4G3G6_SINCU|nr:NADH dehydrogenase subunit 6 [Sinohyriopsis cumingii]